MTEPTLARSTSGSRTKLVINVVLFALLIMLGNQIVDPRISKRVFGVAVALTAIISGVMPAIGREHPRLARRLVYVSVGSVALVFGLLARMLVHSYQAR